MNKNDHHFQADVAGNKYFRQINNKFTKQNFTCELLSPPHNQAMLDRLGTISENWLSQGGRSERGFAMGYFTPAYMQMCQVMVIVFIHSVDCIVLNPNTNHSGVSVMWHTKEAWWDLPRQ